MAAKTIEARLVISGEDKGASAVVERVIAAQQKLAKDTSLSTAMRRNAEEAEKTEKAFLAVQKAMAGRESFAKSTADAKAAEAGLARYTKQLDAARAARAAFGNVRPMKGSEEAAALAAATKGLREATVAHGRAAQAAEKTAAAARMQATAMQQADAAAAHFGVDLTDLAATQGRLRATFDATTAAIGRQIAASERASRIGATMGVSGRAQLDRIEQGRRVAEGMSAPGRAARAEQSAMAREARAAAEAAASAAALRTRSQREARDVAAGVVGAAVGGVVSSTYVKARDGWVEMDEATRRQRAVLSIDEAKQSALSAQALKIGQDTRFSNTDVVKAQTRIGASLPDHVKTSPVIAAITENAKDYALAMGTTMDEAADLVKARMLALKADLSSPEATAAAAKHATNRLVQFAKSSGADHNDLVGYTKFGAAPSRVAGFSEEFSDAMGAQLRRIGYEGAMAGNFVRAAGTRLSVPTSKGLGVLAAAGFNHSDYVTPGNEMSAANLDKMLKLKFGKGMSRGQQARINELMDDEDVVGNREEFVPRVSAIIQETLARGTRRARSTRRTPSVSRRQSTSTCPRPLRPSTSSA